MAPLKKPYTLRLALGIGPSRAIVAVDYDALGDSVLVEIELDSAPDVATHALRLHLTGRCHQTLDGAGDRGADPNWAHAFAPAAESRAERPSGN